MFFDAFPHDTFEFLICFFHQVRIEDRLFNVCMYIQFLLDRFEDIGVITVFVFLDLFKESFNKPVICLQQIECIRLRRGDEAG